MEDNLTANKSKSFQATKKSSLNSKSKNSEPKESSYISKKSKQEINIDEEDLTNKILSNLTYENFESEKEKFFPHYRKKHEEIYIDNVSLLDQNRFRFLISNNSSIFNEYTKYEKGNFKNIKWDDIKLVYYYYVEEYQCPICLENKLCCPIIINCGHIFCYPCFLNFYDYSTKTIDNKKLPKCPLCSENIDLEKNSIKFCEMIQCKNYTNQMQIKFNLIMREKTSPTLFNLVYDPSLIKWKKIYKYQMRSIPFEISKEFIFSRIFSTNKTLTKERINNMINETKEALKEEKEFYADERKIKSFEQCIEILENISKKNEEEKDFIIENVFNKEKEKEKNNNININSNNKNKFDDFNNNINEIKNEINDNNNNIKEEEEINYKNYFFFYQEEEGDIYYLDPFIMDILLAEYGDYSNLPVVISGNILEVNMKQITPNIKSNYPYLSHLNLGSIIFFVEIDVNKLISPFTRKKFSHVLNERAKKRRLLSNEEKNYEKFINKKSIKEKEEMQNYFLFHNKNNIRNEKKGGEINNIKFNYHEEIEDGIDDIKNEEKKEEKKDNEENEGGKKKENMLKKLFEESAKEEEEKEKQEKERLEKEKKEREKKNIFVFDEKEFPEFKEATKIDNKEKEENNNNNENKGGKKGKKKGKKKFVDVEEDFLADAFKPEENPKPKWKKSSKHN